MYICEAICCRLFDLDTVKPSSPALTLSAQSVSTYIELTLGSWSVKTTLAALAILPARMPAKPHPDPSSTMLPAPARRRGWHARSLHRSRPAGLLAATDANQAPAHMAIACLHNTARHHAIAAASGSGKHNSKTTGKRLCQQMIADVPVFVWQFAQQRSLRYRRRSPDFQAQIVRSRRGTTTCTR